jgi:methionyl-tRNA formyltransferase
MRVVFAGTPDFSVPSLEALANTSFIDLVGVYTQPDRPAGRGKKLQKSPVKIAAEALGMPVFQPVSFRSSEVTAQLEALNVDLMVVTAYGLLLPGAVLDMIRLGCVNVHASLLPRWRGAAPVQRAIEAGDQETGITLMQMQVELDSGPILAQSKIAISEDETGGSLHQKLSAMGGELLRERIGDICAQRLKPAPQDSKLVTYAKKLHKTESALDWRQNAQHMERKIRAFNPWPMTTVSLSGTALRVLAASYRDDPATGVAGEVLNADKTGILVQAGDGQLNLEVLQKAGGRAMTAAEYLNGTTISRGMVFDAV